MFAFDPKDRLTIEEIEDHPWLKGGQVAPKNEKVDDRQLFWLLFRLFLVAFLWLLNCFIIIQKIIII